MVESQEHATISAEASRRPKDALQPKSILILCLAWLLLQVGGLFSPGLLDDVDSVYLEVAREMLHRHDFITPYVDGIRFFDKPPLMYWMAAGSMHLFGEHDWAGRLPLALAVLALLLAVYALGRRLYSERGGLYGALALGTSVGPYLYTRFFIPDIVIALWMTLAVYLFLSALDRVGEGRSALWHSIGFGVVLGLNLLTKGLIGVFFPLAFVTLYLVLTRQGRTLHALRPGLAALAFTLIALPWHLLAAMRNPAIAMPAGQGLPARAGWAWFYLYNEHFARFAGKRIPHDYGQTPIWLFLLYAVIWLLPWAAFLPAALSSLRTALGHRVPVTARQRGAALTVSLWAGLVLLFFCVSNRQEYYSIPALPALALMLGGTLAAAEHRREIASIPVSACSRWILLPLSLGVAAVCGYFAVTAPTPPPGQDLSGLLQQNSQMYNLSLGHLFDLTGAAMALFRGPLALVVVGMLVLGPGSFLLRRRGSDYAANLLLAGGMTLVLLAAHEGLVRFNPILGSKSLAQVILAEQRTHPDAADLILVDGELTSGSTLLFYTGEPLHLVNGRRNGPWFGSFWPDAPPIFEDDASLLRLWDGPARIFLLTADPLERRHQLPNARVIASAGGKTLLVNR